MSKLIKKNDATFVDLGTKFITKYTSEDKSLEINHMKIHGRHPENPEHFVYEEQVHFMLYVVSGTGTVWCDSECYEVSVGDVVDVPAKTKFAVDSTDETFEYFALQSPAWSPEQAFIVNKEGTVVEQTTK